jgi:hypothetical protein
MITPEADTTYLIELCSGEQRRWHCLGPDARGAVWWRDLETKMEFSEGSVMYAWSIVERVDAD